MAYSPVSNKIVLENGMQYIGLLKTVVHRRRFHAHIRPLFDQPAKKVDPTLWGLGSTVLYSPVDY